MIQNSATLVHHFLEQSARQYPEKTALIHDGADFSYSVINEQANLLAHHFIEMGFSRNERLAFLFENSIEYVISYYAALKAGLVATPLGTDLKPDGLLNILRDIEPSVIIAGGRFEKLLKSIDIEMPQVREVIIKAPKLSWASADFPVNSWEGIVGNGSSRSNPECEIDENSLASIIYTSGSTGAKKGVMLSHSNIVSNTFSICQYLQLTMTDIQMVVLPFFYVMGKSLLNTHFAVGGTVAISNKFAYPASFLQEMAALNVTGFSGVPSTYAYLLHRSPLASYRERLNNLRYCTQAGGHMSKAIKEKLRVILPPHTKIYVMYGATEAAARLSYLEPDFYSQKMDSIGRAIPGVSLSIKDSNGSQVGPGQIGELVAKGQNIMLGYWKDLQSTAKVIQDGWYHTGDLSYFDHEGFFYLVGRKDEMLKVGGHKINPQEIEDILMQSDFLVEVVVLGVQDDLLGNKLVAVAVPRDKNCDVNEIKRFCAEKLPRYKVPDKLEFIKSLPKNITGKIDRRKCLDLLGTSGQKHTQIS
jgi:acyl-CoA synthetase (AMP-forming)/AMP-acid ligase II